MPYDIDPSFVKPVYKELKGWSEDLTGMSDIEELPVELKNYIEFLEAELEVPITIVSVGPKRSQTLIRKSEFFAIEA